MSTTVIENLFAYTATIPLKSGSTTITEVTQPIINGTPQPLTLFGVPTTLPPDLKPFSILTTISKDTKLIASASPQTTSIAPNSASSTVTAPSISTDRSSSSKSTSDASSSSSPSTSGDDVSSHSAIPSESTNGNRTKHISSGDAAGIGIGSAIGGALIAALLVWFLMRKSHKRGRRSRGETPTNGFTGRGRNSEAFIDSESTTLEFEDRSASAIVERALPQPPDDHTVGGEMSKLRTLIKNHVQSYYHNGLLKSTSTDMGRAVMEVAAESMPISASTLTSLLSNPRTRIPALRFFLAWTIIQRLEPTCDLGRTFLPPEVAGCFKSMATKEELTPIRMAFLSKWRSISAFLLQKNYGQPNFSKDDARIPNISKGLETLDSVLFLYADESRDNQERLLNLEEIIKRAARFGYLLVSQPSLWKFEWDRSTGSALVVFPGLQQVGDDNGQKMRMPRVVGEPEIFRGSAGT